jgi:hypothetical protein
LHTYAINELNNEGGGWWVGGQKYILKMIWLILLNEKRRTLPLP